MHIKIKYLIEAALFAATTPLSIKKLINLFPEYEQPSVEIMQAALDELATDYHGRSIELQHVASGYRFQVRQEYTTLVERLVDEKPRPYSRAFLETIVLIAYRQPITRAEIEDIRGVSVNPAIIKSLLEREWIRVIGHKDTPGRPALYATTREFLDYFNLKSLKELPPLVQLDPIENTLNFETEAMDAIAVATDTA